MLPWLCGNSHTDAVLQDGNLQGASTMCVCVCLLESPQHPWVCICMYINMVCIRISIQKTYHTLQRFPDLLTKICIILKTYTNVSDISRTLVRYPRTEHGGKWCKIPPNNNKGHYIPNPKNAILKNPGNPSTSKKNN